MLKEYMSDLSEEAYSARWMQHLEYALWLAVENGPRKYGRLAISKEHIAKLISLSKKCGGWVYWNEQSEETWITIEDWEKMFKENLPTLGVD